MKFDRRTFGAGGGNTGAVWGEALALTCAGVANPTNNSTGQLNRDFMHRRLEAQSDEE
jgi:hypothetical protein